MVAWTRNTSSLCCPTAAQKSRPKLRHGCNRVPLRTAKLNAFSRAEFVNSDEKKPESERKSKESGDRMSVLREPDTGCEEKASHEVSEDMKNAETIMPKPVEMVEHFRFWAKCIHGQGAVVRLRNSHKSLGAS